MNKIIDNNSMITTIMNGDNETIINSCFNDAENEICNNKEFNAKNKNAFNQCILFWIVNIIIINYFIIFFGVYKTHIKFNIKLIDLYIKNKKLY